MPHLIAALYDSNSAVVELTEANFKTRVLNDDSIWIVEFYAPWYLPLLPLTHPFQVRALQEPGPGVRESREGAERPGEGRRGGHDPAPIRGRALQRAGLPDHQSLRREQEIPLGLSRHAIAISRMIMH